MTNPDGTPKYLYFSPFDMYESCPQRFLWSRGWPTINLGYGLGKRKPKPVKESRHHAAMGQIIGKVVEDFFEQEWWKHRNGLHDRMSTAVDAVFKAEMETQYIDWRQAPPRGEMLQVCRDGVSGFLRTVHANKLFGPWAKAEYNLLGWVNEYTPVGGRCDVIFRRDDTGTTILDGKNSKEKGKYTNPDQLRWYALCHYLAFGRLPERLGFIYFRFPYDAEKGESGVDWVPCTKEDVRGLASRAVDAQKKMHKERFEANPVPSYCKFCEYETVCPERIAQKAHNSRNRHPKESASIDTGGGFVNLDLK